MRKTLVLSKDEVIEAITAYCKAAGQIAPEEYINNNTLRYLGDATSDIIEITIED